MKLRSCVCCSHRQRLKTTGAVPNRRADSCGGAAGRTAPQKRVRSRRSRARRTLYHVRRPHARQFLLSSQVHYENETSKRRFLQERGLSEDEIGLLLHEQVRIAPFSYASNVEFRQSVLLPAAPPRTYPQPPPSNH
jgi:hypothetical protein